MGNIVGSVSVRKFRVSKNALTNKRRGRWFVYQYEPDIVEIAEFLYGLPPYHTEEIALAMAEDYCEFLNEKYRNKNINEDWRKFLVG